MSENAVATISKNDPGPLPEAVELALVSNDLSKLSAPERLAYLRRLCDSLALNWLTNPFQYIVLNGKLTLYATRACADQLRKRDKVSIGPPEVRFEDGLVVVSVTARTADGREDSELGVVSLDGLKGETRANAILKAITKAKRRVTLSICGLGWLDETEVETIPGARLVNPDEPDEAVPSGETTPGNGASTRCHVCGDALPANVAKACQKRQMAPICVACHKKQQRRQETANGASTRCHVCGDALPANVAKACQKRQMAPICVACHKKQQRRQETAQAAPEAHANADPDGWVDPDVPEDAAPNQPNQ